MTSKGRRIGRSFPRFMLLETKNPQLGWIAIVLGLAVGRAAMYGPQASSRREGEREEPGGEQWHAIFRGLRRFRFCVILIFVNENYLGREQHGECLR